MGFLPNYDGPGPERDLPRKTGIPRLWEMLSRDFWDLFRAGFLALVGCVPFLLGVLYSLSTHVLIYAPAAGLLGGAVPVPLAPAGPDGAVLFPAGEKLGPALSGPAAPERRRPGHYGRVLGAVRPVLPVCPASAALYQPVAASAACPVFDLPRHQ